MFVNLVKISVIEMTSFEITTQLAIYKTSALLDNFIFRDFVVTNINNTIHWIANKLTLEKINKMVYYIPLIFSTGGN